MQRVRFASQAQAGKSGEPQPVNSIRERRKRMKGKQVCFVLVFASGKSGEPQPVNSIRERRRRMKGKQVCFVLVFASGKNKSEGAFLYSREDVIAFVLNLKIQYILINSYNNQINLMVLTHAWLNVYI